MQPETPNFRRWLAAEKEAHASERDLHEAMLQFAGDMGHAPTAQAVLAVQAKRARAHALFEDAIHELKSLAEALHRGQPSSAGANGETASTLQDAAFHQLTPPPGHNRPNGPT
jgi:hypothetical protein